MGLSKKVLEQGNAKVLHDDSLISIPVLEKASSGNGYINFSNELLYNKLIRKNGFHENCYSIKSIWHFYGIGAFVVVDPYQTNYIENKVYVIKYEKETYIKKVILKPEAKIMILKNINPDFEDIYISDDQSDQVKII